jgi:hypothetical protein
MPLTFEERVRQARSAQQGDTPVVQHSYDPTMGGDSTPVEPSTDDSGYKQTAPGKFEVGTSSESVPGLAPEVQQKVKAMPPTGLDIQAGDKPKQNLPFADPSQITPDAEHPAYNFFNTDNTALRSEIATLPVNQQAITAARKIMDADGKPIGLGNITIKDEKVYYRHNANEQFRQLDSDGFNLGDLLPAVRTVAPYVAADAMATAAAPETGLASLAAAGVGGQALNDLANAPTIAGNDEYLKSLNQKPTGDLDINPDNIRRETLNVGISAFTNVGAGYLGKAMGVFGKKVASVLGEKIPLISKMLTKKQSLMNS